MNLFLKKTGFTLIELLIVIAIIGIIAAIAIPNLLTALHKGKQKVTMADIKSVGMAIESYIVDIYHVPNVAAGGLQAILQPFHIKKMPLIDGWGYTWQYQHGIPGDFDQENYSLGSGGKDGILFNWIQTGGYRVQSSGDFFNDIIFANGQFSYFPIIK